MSAYFCQKEGCGEIADRYITYTVEGTKIAIHLCHKHGEGEQQ